MLLILIFFQKTKATKLAINFATNIVAHTPSCPKNRTKTKTSGMLKQLLAMAKISDKIGLSMAVKILSLTSTNQAHKNTKPKIIKAWLAGLINSSLELKSQIMDFGAHSTATNALKQIKAEHKKLSLTRAKKLRRFFAP